MVYFRILLFSGTTRRRPLASKDQSSDPKRHRLRSETGLMEISEQGRQSLGSRWVPTKEPVRLA